MLRPNSAATGTVVSGQHVRYPGHVGTYETGEHQTPGVLL